MAEAIGRAKVILEVDAASYSAALEKANSKLKIFGQQAASAGHATVSSMQASSGALRLVQGNIENNVRAVERLLTTIPGVGAALQALFPLVGGLAFAGMLAKMGTEFYDFIQKAQQVPKAIQQGFESLNLSARTTNDELDVTNDKLENQIAKLEHRGQNNIKLALDEAKVSADQFAQSVEKAASEVEKLIAENKISFTQSFFTDTERTAPLAGTIKSFEDDKRHFAAQAAIGKSEGDQGKYDKNTKAFHDKEQAELVKMQAVLADAQKKQAEMVGVTRKNQNQAPTITMAQGVIDNIQLSRAHEGSLKRHSVDEAQLASDQAAKDETEEQKKADAELLKNDVEAEKKQNAFNKMSINEEISFWTDKIKAFTAGSDAYRSVQDKIYDLIASRPSLFSVNKETQDKRGKSDVEGGNILRESQEKLITAPAIAQNERSTASAERYNEAVAKGLEIQYRAKAAYDETAISIALAQGTVTRLGAAHELAAIHGEEQAAALKRINAELATQISLINQNAKLTKEDPANAIRNANEEAVNRRAEVNAQGRQQAQQDAASIYGQTATGKTVQALNDMVNAWDNMSASIVAVFTRAADQLNSAASDAILGNGGHHKISDQVSSTLHGAASGLMKSALEKGESAIGKALGFGGGKVQHVWVENFPGGGGGAASQGLHGLAGKAVGWLGGLFGKGGGATSVLPEGGGYDWGSNPLQGLLGAMPMLAGGGDMPAGSSAWVGEKGPEIFHSKSAGRIIPNHEIGGGGTSHVYHIDARQAQDPAAVHAAVARALPHAVAASMQAQHQHARRTPAGR